MADIAPAPATTYALPPVVSRPEWEAARQDLLQQEKALTKQADAVAAARRRLPMVEITKEYTFTGPDGERSFPDLFAGHRQLIVHHFMFDPEWDEGCPSCSNLADSFPHLAHLHARDIAVVRISRAPYPKLAAYNARLGWDVPWFSSFGSDFNRNFGYTDDNGEMPGTSVFLRDDATGRIFQTYTTTGRGVESQSSEAGYLDITPYGRQEDWEDSPTGWPQRPAFSWTRRHDEYDSNG